jgi:hypothetical protein
MKFALASVVVVGVIIFAVSSQTWTSPTERQFKAVAASLPTIRSRAEAAGFPMSKQEIAIPPVNASQNAWLEINEALLSPELESGLVPAVNLPFTDIGIKQLRFFFKKAEMPLKMIEEACMKPRFQTIKDWSKPISVASFAEVDQLMVLARIFASRAVVATIDGDKKRAELDLKIIFRLAEYASEMRLFMSELKSALIKRLGFTTIERCLGIHPFSIQPWSFVPEEISQPYILDLIRRETGTLTYYADGWYSEEDAEDINPGFAKKHKAVLSEVKDRSLVDRAYWARYLESLLELQGEKTPTDLFYKIVDAESRTKKSDDLTWAAAGFKMETTAKVVVNFIECNVELELIEAMQAALLYFDQFGKYPKNLADAKFTKIDPFSGKPYRIISTDRGFRIYSFGRNRKDNGGKEISEVGNDKSADIVVIYPRSLVRKVR